MKTKTDATKVLLEAGWTYEEIEAVLSITVSPNYDWGVQPLETPMHPWYPTVTWCDSNKNSSCPNSE